MTGLVEGMKKVAESEVAKIHVAELGVVTSVFPHADEGDNDNYECSVKLRDKDVELRQVPVATSHIGFASIPQVGDLVLVSFVNGDINAPVITGRLYNDEDRPPASQAEEMVYIPPYESNPDLRRIYVELPDKTVTLTIQDEEITIHVGDTDVKVSKEEGVSVTSKKPITISTEDDLSIKAKTVKIESDSDTSITASGKTTIKGSTIDLNP
ncbi:MAG TPA: phage baseplate assembly protein V [Nitrososphaerales archaeon]|nr:phage baseplate assembly protein V [Nitrososphaerales archaeon]HUK74291.1 phage baseplate assembly protein V [Nitrososphaerales archaeon]